MAYEKKFKERVLEHLGKGNTHHETAKLYGIGTTTLSEWKRLEKQGDNLETKPRKRKPKKIEPEKLRAYVQSHPDAYLSEIAGEFNCATSSVHAALVKLGMTRKKRV